MYPTTTTIYGTLNLIVHVELQVQGLQFHQIPKRGRQGIFEFHLTNSQELNSSAQSNLAADAQMRILQDAYRSVFYCFPVSAVPSWFPYHCKGHSVTLNLDSLNMHA